MKKIYLFLILSLQGLFLGAQGNKVTVTINLDEQNIADVLLNKQWCVNKLILSGHMKAEDFTYINDCDILRTLDLTDAIVDSIPPHSMTNANMLLDLYLPKKKTIFNVNAVKNLSRWQSDIITIHVTGYFPVLNSLSSVLESEYGLQQDPQQLYFTTEEGNECCAEPFKGVIFSADMDTLFKFSPIVGYEEGLGYSGEEEKEFLNHHTNVKVIAPYVFAYMKICGSFYFSDSLKMICHNAFDGSIMPPVTTGGGGYLALSIYLGNNPPQIELPAYDENEDVVYIDDWSWYLNYNPFIIYIPSLRTYLETSSLWAETPIFPKNFQYMMDYNNNDRRYYTFRDKDGKPLYYTYPHIIETDKYIVALNVDNIAFTRQSAGSDSIISADMDVEYGAYYRYIVSWTTIADETSEYPDWNPCHYVEHFDTIYSPIPDEDELTYDIEIVDDEGNVVFSSRRKGGKGSTEHVSGVLTNVPQSQQGDLKSRTSGMRYGESPWKSQRVNFGSTGIASPQLSPEGKGGWFDLTGRPVDGTQKGILIRNGKKVLIR